MSIDIRKYWSSLTRREPAQPEVLRKIPEVDLQHAQAQEVEIAASDPLYAYLLNVTGIVDVAKLALDSPALLELKKTGVKLSVPLVSQGELIGLLNLGPRLSEQDYSTYDLHLLNNLATQAAPALRVAQLARQQQIQARERERIEQELRVARVIQETLLPKQVPELPGWHLAADWRPARAVSGDFYDFITFPSGKLGLIMGDVTDKGVPAALVMATTRSVLRSTAERLLSPSVVLEQTNNLLCPNIPPNMFVTCLYAVLDPSNGKLQFANAGHNLPYLFNSQGVRELRATGMPLGLMPDMVYEEKEADLASGDSLLIYSDGLIEAHNPQGEMFGFPRLRELLAHQPGERGVIHLLVDQLAEFTGPDWEQEDDVTFLTLGRAAGTGSVNAHKEVLNSGLRTLAEFTLPSQPGNERQAIQEVTSAVQELDLPVACLERLQTAVGEATMNAMEHGNHYQLDLMVMIGVFASEEKLVVLITDHGGGQKIPESEQPDLEAKLEGLQSPRGWGLFLIKNMVDEMHVITDEHHHTLELVMNLKGGEGNGTNL
jgi:serine phosphatase RsbU (regulator of sigma subunit)/anti-sigma regulatory factor (Ser/Thr protein kinase)